MWRGTFRKDFQTIYLVRQEDLNYWSVDLNPLFLMTNGSQTNMKTVFFKQSRGKNEIYLNEHKNKSFNL